MLDDAWIDNHITCFSAKASLFPFALVQKPGCMKVANGMELQHDNTNIQEGVGGIEFVILATFKSFHSYRRR